MGKKFIVEGAMCTCKFGTTPGILKVIDQSFAHINGKKLIATTTNLGNVFQTPGFTICKMIPTVPKPCVPAIVMWSGAFQKAKVNNIGAILTDKSKGTCTLGCPNCISFIRAGQIAMPGAPQMDEASKEFQGDLDPTGESLALNEHQIDCLLRIKTS